MTMSNAIVRSAIANSTIEEMLRNREALRGQIRTEMFEVVSGWGVWLETIEITDVQIKSSALFKDLQAPYRENIKQTAQVYKMEIDAELNKIRSDKQEAVKKVKDELNAEIKIYQDKHDV